MSCMFCTGLFTALKTNAKDSDATAPALTSSPNAPVAVLTNSSADANVNMLLPQNGNQSNKVAESTAELLFGLVKDKNLNNPKLSTNSNLSLFTRKFQTYLVCGSSIGLFFNQLVILER